MSLEEWGRSIFPHVTQNGTQCKAHKLLIFWLFYLIFSDLILPWLTKTVENKTIMGAGVGGLL